MEREYVIGRWFSLRRPAPSDDERGYTFIELIISIVLMTMITGAIAAALVTAMNGSRGTADNVRQSNDAQVIAAFFVRDAQAAGGSNPNTAALDPSLGVSLTDAAGCTDPADPSATLVVRFKWLDRYVDTGTHAQTHKTDVASYFLSSNKLTRQLCVSGSTNSSLTLANNIDAILPSGTAVCITGNAPSSCAPTLPGGGPGLPDAVQMSVSALRPSDSAPTAYAYTLTANVRPEAQCTGPAVGASLPCTPPNGVSPFSPALLALSACSPGTSGVSVSGGANVAVAGAVVVNGVDNGTCTALSLNGAGLYSAINTSIVAGGTCGGNNCAQAGTIGSYPTQLLDPYEGTPPPGDCSGPTTGSFSGGHYTPGVYQSAVTVNNAVTFDPGIYIFCNGVTFQAGATEPIVANGVLFYVANGEMKINSHSNVTMTALNSGPYAGMLIWIPITNSTTSFTINGGATVNTYSGLIYAPGCDVVVNGNSGSNIGSIIARTISFSGGGQNIIGYPPSITGPLALPDWTIFNDYGSATRPATVTATGGTTPYHWSASGLPAGLAIDPDSGAVGGIPTAPGTSSSIVVTVTDDLGLTATRNYSVTIYPAPTITGPANLPASTQGVPYPTGPSTTITASGGTPNVKWFASGLPDGMSIAQSSGGIFGTPTASGTFTVTVTVADAVGVTATHDYSLTINSPPTIGTTALPDWTEDRPGYSATVSASNGTGPYTWSASGLPRGLSIGTTTGVISGTPNPNQPGTSSVTISITDSRGATDTESYFLTINPTPTITNPGALPPSTVNRSYPPGGGQAVITATGGTAPYAWSASGLHTGLTINSSTGVISGTPTATGTNSVIVTMTDAAGATATRTYSLRINSAPSINPGSLPNWSVNRPGYSATVSGSAGTTPYSWAASGMPSGLTMGLTTGVISGTPTSTGSFTITVTLTDTAGATATHDFTMTVYTTPAVSTTSLPGWDANNAPAYSVTLAATGGSGTYTWARTGNALPPGLSLSTAGVISGTPTTAGTYSGLVFQVTDSMGSTSTSGSMSIVISPHLSVTTNSLASATQGQAASYSQSLAQTGGLGPFIWSLQSGSLPTGLSLSAAGTISGTIDPAATTQTFTVAVTDANNVTATKALTITVNAGPIVSTNTLADGAQGTAYSRPLAVTGGTGPYTWTLSSGSLPTGLSLSTGGTIAGTIDPAATTQTFTVAVTDANGVASPGKSLTITVNPRPTITSISPTTGPKKANGVVITITGTGFISGATVQMVATSGTAPTIVGTATWLTSTQLQITINIPNQNSVNNIVVTNPDGGTATTIGAFTV